MNREKLEALCACNGMRIYSVGEERFASYGRIVTGYDFSEMTAYMERHTKIPEDGNQYLASVPELEQTAVMREVGRTLYGGMQVQAGYCNGRNTTYNGFEYHKCSEINVAVTDFMLVLGHTWDLRDNRYYTNQPDVFFVEAGCAVEIYQTTLHLSPCRVCDSGFKDIVILARGTNTPLEESTGCADDGESELLLQKNKWVVSHPGREPLIRQGAYPGVLGENISLSYPASCCW